MYSNIERRLENKKSVFGMKMKSQKPEKAKQRLQTSTDSQSDLKWSQKYTQRSPDQAKQERSQIWSRDQDKYLAGKSHDVTECTSRETVEDGHFET